MHPAWNLLACSVRGCGLPLDLESRAFRCANGHAFDVARSGYVNLLQPQDRRSLAAGDAKETVQARRRLRDKGVGSAVDAALRMLLAEHAARADAAVADLGCGTGDHLVHALADSDRRGVGFDLSAHAVESAARAFSTVAPCVAWCVAWCVANCDRVLPLRSRAVDVVLSIDARRPRDEIARVLAPGGVVIVAVPGAGDLRELRAATLDDARDLPGLARVVDEFEGVFELVTRVFTVEPCVLDAAGLRDLSLATYRHARRREDERLATLRELEVTIAHEVGLFRAARG